MDFTQQEFTIPKMYDINIFSTLQIYKYLKNIEKFSVEKL